MDPSCKGSQRVRMVVVLRQRLCKRPAGVRKLARQQVREEISLTAD